MMTDEELARATADPSVSRSTSLEMIAFLRSIADVLGSQKALARELGISTTYLGDVLQGRRGISPHIAEQVGYGRVVLFVDRASAKRSNRETARMSAM